MLAPERTLHRGRRYEGTGAHLNGRAGIIAEERGTFGSKARGHQEATRAAAAVSNPYFPESARHFRLRTDLAPSYSNGVHPAATVALERAAAGRLEMLAPSPRARGLPEWWAGGATEHKPTSHLAADTLSPRFVDQFRKPPAEAGPSSEPPPPEDSLPRALSELADLRSPRVRYTNAEIVDPLALARLETRLQQKMLELGRMQAGVYTPRHRSFADTLLGQSPRTTRRHISEEAERLNESIPMMRRIDGPEVYFGSFAARGDVAIVSGA